MADTCWRMACFNFGKDGGLSGSTFNLKNSHNHKSKGVRPGDLGGHVRGKGRFMARSSSNVERISCCTGAATCGGSLSCIKVTVCSACRFAILE
ncbi:hypothetical protein AVEN_272096-1 [Araneus ventricosus]|uniref:Uncharacterized protein n=1 Tax=Araneus ventricosus TaxID=182803 RepID=A0A4Y2J207_ARAVE|nr:hypothetical protein AVEN_272096-1 [Araneus ventricosus]